MSGIRLEGLRKSFSKGAPIHNDVSLAVADGERLAVIGPSGAGKTTLLRLIAGFEKVDGGRIFLGDKDVTELPPEQRDVGFVFQSHALYPHLTVEENLGFPLKLRGVARDEIRRRVGEMTALLQVESFLKRQPQELSGGEAQRVALGRALIRQPAALLMDEPLSSLAPDLRLQLRHELVKVHASRRCPLIYVTHDHEDALAIGQRVAVLNHGYLQQCGTAREIYEHPLNRFVAGFVGKPAMNFVGAEALPRLRVADAETFGFRPEDLEFCGPEDGWFQGVVEDVQYGGSHSDVFVKCEAATLIARNFGECKLAVGENVRLRPKRGRIHAFDGSGNRVSANFK